MENVSAAILFGRNFFMVFLVGTFLQTFLVGMSLQRSLGRDFLFMDYL